MSAECLGILKSILSKILVHFMAFISASGWCLVSCYNDVSCLIDGRPDLLRLNHVHCLTKKKKHLGKGAIKFTLCEKI